MDEARWYYAGLPSSPTLLYRTGKQWFPPTRPEAYTRRLKELRPVFNHPIVEIWNKQLSVEIVDLLDARQLRFTTIDVVRFKMEVDNEYSEEETVIGPVTIWIGVFLEITSATAAHDAAQEILALLAKYKIMDVDVDFRGSIYMHEVDAVLAPPADDFNPHPKITSPIAPALGLQISTRARPNTESTLAVYLVESGTGSKDRLLGLSSRHVLISPQEPNTPVAWHPKAPSRDVLLLSTRAFYKLVDSIRLKVGRHGIAVEQWKNQIENFKRQEAGDNDDALDANKATTSRMSTELLVTKAEEAMEALQTFLDALRQDWKSIDKRVLGPVLYSPPTNLGVGDERFTEDWGIFEVDRAKLGPSFQGNIMDLGTNMSPEEFTRKCYPRDDTNWSFKYPTNGLLPLTDILTDHQMCHPDMFNDPDTFNPNREPCLLVVKSGNTTGTTIGRANGVFSIVRKYYPHDMNLHCTSLEWGILSYGNVSGAFSKPGDSGSIIADIKGRIGGMLTGGSGKMETTTLDITYATPFWWLLKRIEAANDIPGVHFSIHV